MATGAVAVGGTDPEIPSRVYGRPPGRGHLISGHEWIGRVLEVRPRGSLAALIGVPHGLVVHLFDQVERSLPSATTFRRGARRATRRQ